MITHPEFEKFPVSLGDRKVSWIINTNEEKLFVLLAEAHLRKRTLFERELEELLGFRNVRPILATGMREVTHYVLSEEDELVFFGLDMQKLALFPYKYKQLYNAVSKVINSDETKDNAKAVEVFPALTDEAFVKLNAKIFPKKRQTSWIKIFIYLLWMRLDKNKFVDVKAINTFTDVSATSIYEALDKLKHILVTKSGDRKSTLYSIDLVALNANEKLKELSECIKANIVETTDIKIDSEKKTGSQRCNEDTSSLSSSDAKSEKSESSFKPYKRSQDSFWKSVANGEYSISKKQKRIEEDEVTRSFLTF